ncbi:SCP2 sterol-binding domain-containing protein [Metabacillus herbersteinensis]|uniref:SCP2 sterol-binding domain-containing protein n=1 Tax=Metabacillus herbersteinensis TaxID=283816 RepID=A0ABV6GCF6_9BACI
MCIDLFLERINELNILTPIYPHHPLTLEIRPTNLKSIYIKITTEGIKQIKRNGGKTSFVIEGAEEEINDLLTGEVKLQQMIKIGAVRVKGSFRDYLRVDAFLQYGQPYSS